MAQDDRPDARAGAGYGYGYGPPPREGSPPQPAPAWAAPPLAPAPRRHLPVRPSPVFGGLVALFVAAGVYLWSAGTWASDVSPPKAMRVGVFVFVAIGWILSLCLHEFAHAAVAWKGGDRSVEGRGYLTLDPRRYMNRQLSIVLPIIIVLIGGIGLPGGAVMIDRRYIPQKGMRSLVSAAGPLTNLVCAVLCALPLQLHLVGSRHVAFASALAFLALLEVAATVLNALPIPGLDGFGVIAPFLPDDTVAALMPISRYVFFGLFIVLIYSTQASSAFFNFCFRILADLGVPNGLPDLGHALFTFWKA